MSAIVRLYAALLAAVVPVLALAQSGEGRTPAPGTPGERGMSWLWWIAAAIILFALVRMIFGRGRRTSGAERRL